MEWRRIKKRRGNRRRRKREPMLMVRARVKEHRRLWRARVSGIVVVVLVLTALLASLWLGTQRLAAWLFSTNDRFTIVEMDVESDGRLTGRHLLEYARVTPGDNLFAVKPAELRARLERVPVIRSAQVCRLLPGTLRIRVRERTALLALDMEGGGMPLVVDRDGQVLGPGSSLPSLPVLTGLGQQALRPGSKLEGQRIEEALSVTEFCSKPYLADHLPLRRIGLAHPDYLDIRLVSGERILLGRDRLEWRLRSVAAILEACRGMNRRVAVIDATGHRNFPVEYR